MKHILFITLIVTINSLLCADPPASTPTTQPTTAASTQAAADAALRAVLARPLPEVGYDGMAFGEVLDSVRDLTSASIYVDWNAVRAAGVTAKTPVSYRLRSAAIGEALAAILKPLGERRNPLAFDIAGPAIIISTHDGLKDFQSAWRIDALKFTLPEYRKLLEQQIPDIRFERTPFSNAIEVLQTAAGIRMTFDETLAINGISRNAPVSLRGKSLPLGLVLRLILHDVGGTTPLDYRIDDAVLSIFVPNPP